MSTTNTYQFQSICICNTHSIFFFFFGSSWSKIGGLCLFNKICTQPKQDYPQGEKKGYRSFRMPHSSMYTHALRQQRKRKCRISIWNCIQRFLFTAEFFFFMIFIKKAQKRMERKKAGEKFVFCIRSKHQVCSFKEVRKKFKCWQSFWI